MNFNFPKPNFQETGPKPRKSVRIVRGFAVFLIIVAVITFFASFSVKGDASYYTVACSVAFLFTASLLFIITNLSEDVQRMRELMEEKDWKLDALLSHIENIDNCMNNYQVEDEETSQVKKETDSYMDL